MSRMISFAVLVTIIVVIGVLFLRVMAGFLLPLFLAAVLVVVFRPVHRRYQMRWPGRPRWCALVTTLTVSLVVMVPIAVVGSLAIIEAASLVANLNNRDLVSKVTNLRQSLGLEIPCRQEQRYVERTLTELKRTAVADPQWQESALENLQDAIRSLIEKMQDLGQADKTVSLEEMDQLVTAARNEKTGSFAAQVLIEQAGERFEAYRIHVAGSMFRLWLQDLANPSPAELEQWVHRAIRSARSWLPSLGGATRSFVFHVLLGMAISLVAVYFFLADGPAIAETVMHLSPLEDSYERELFSEFDRVSRAVVVATLLSAVVQGLAGGMGYWLAGVTPVFLLMIFTGVLALIPFVGAAAVWVPVCLWLCFAEQRYVAAGLLAIYGVLVISSIDNVLKPIVLHGQSRLHPLLALLSVLGGVQAMGPAGILFGPMIVVFLQSLLDILRREVAEWEPRPGRRRKTWLPAILSLRTRQGRVRYAPLRGAAPPFWKEPPV